MATGHSESACSLQKARLRREMTASREQLSAEDCLRAAEGFRRCLPRLIEKSGLAGRPLRVAVYAAMRMEADLSLVCEDLVNAGHEIYYPAVQGRGASARLVFARLPEGVTAVDFLKPGCFGVSEPAADCWLDDAPQFDLMLLPGLAFDLAGNRLGWGRAFYDRLISRMPRRPVLAGVCYPFQILPEGVPCQETDQPVDWLLTPEQPLPCQAL